MKVRLGFVSNSSSSSFIVARVLVGDENFQKIKDALNRAEEEDEETYWTSNVNYISGEVSHHCGAFWDEIEAMKLPKDSYISVGH